MLGAFFDDSGTHAGSPVVVMGGLLGTAPQWNHFAENWTALLKAPYPYKPPLPHFHLTHCRNGLGEFANYSLAERGHLNYRFGGFSWTLSSSRWRPRWTTRLGKSWFWVMSPNSSVIPLSSASTSVSRW